MGRWFQGRLRSRKLRNTWNIQIIPKGMASSANKMYTREKQDENSIWSVKAMRITLGITKIVPVDREEQFNNQLHQFFL